MANYYTIWTETGQSKLANAQSTGTAVAITEMGRRVAVVRERTAELLGIE